MILLVVHYQTASRLRPTVGEHLRAFETVPGVEVHYLNAAFGVPAWISSVPFDAVLLHYTLLATKWDPAHFRRVRERCAPLRALPAVKVAFPQDEYVHSAAVCELFDELDVRAVFSVAPPPDRERIYAPARHRLAVLDTVLTGYIDERTRDRLAARHRSARERQVDVGYRGRRVPFWLGRRAQIKWQMAEPVRRAAEARGLRVDVSCEPSAELRGGDWHRFLGECRVTLGCEGGASLLDTTGETRAAVESYLSEQPGASFDEVEGSCFAGRDDTLDLFVLSPRQFESCLTRTCQVLVEGCYSGVLEPERHYIPLRRDLSNLEEVLDRVSDVGACEAMAERAWHEVGLKDELTYGAFARRCLGRLRPLLAETSRRGHPAARAALRARGWLTQAALAARDGILRLCGSATN